MSCCLSSCRSRSKIFCRDSLSCSSIRDFLLQGHLLGLDFGLLAAGLGFDLGLFEDQLGLFFRVALPQIPQQLEEPHPHAGSNRRDDDEDPGIMISRRGNRRLGKQNQVKTGGHCSLLLAKRSARASGRSLLPQPQREWNSQMLAVSQQRAEQRAFTAGANRPNTAAANGPLVAVATN